MDFSAKETLDILQGLYERHKVVTYPRTDSRYITSDILPTLNRRIESLTNTVLGPVARQYLTGDTASMKGASSRMRRSPTTMRSSLPKYG